MRTLILAILALALAPLASWAETPKDSWENLKQLPPGHKIKIVDMKYKSWSGRFVAVSDEAITIRDKRTQQEITVDRANVLRVNDLERSHRAWQSLIGFAVGTTVGFIALDPSEDRPGIAVVVFGLPGMAIGAALPNRPTVYRAQRPDRNPFLK